MSVMVGLNMCDWTSCSSPLGIHVASPFAQRPRGVRGALPPGRGVWEAFAPPRKQDGLVGRKPRNSIPRQTQNIHFCQINLARQTQNLHFCQINLVAGCRLVMLPRRSGNVRLRAMGVREALPRWSGGYPPPQESRAVLGERQAATISAMSLVCSFP